MNQMENFLSQKDLLKETGITFYCLEYLIKLGVVPVIRYGKGIERKFPQEALDIIRERQKKLNTNHED